MAEVAAIAAAVDIREVVAEPSSAPAAVAAGEGAPAATAAVAEEFDCHNRREKRAGRHSGYSRYRNSSAGQAVEVDVERAVAVSTWLAEAAEAGAAAGQEVAGIGRVRARIRWTVYS